MGGACGRCIFEAVAHGSFLRDVEGHAQIDYNTTSSGWVLGLLGGAVCGCGWLITLLGLLFVIPVGVDGCWSLARKQEARQPWCFGGQGMGAALVGCGPFTASLCVCMWGREGDDSLIVRRTKFPGAGSFFWIVEGHRPRDAAIRMPVPCSVLVIYCTMFMLVTYCTMLVLCC